MLFLHRTFVSVWVQVFTVFHVFPRFHAVQNHGDQVPVPTNVLNNESLFSSLFCFCQIYPLSALHSEGLYLSDHVRETKAKAKVHQFRNGGGCLRSSVPRRKTDIEMKIRCNSMNNPMTYIGMRKLISRKQVGIPSVLG